MSKLKVQGYTSLVRDTSSNAIVNTSVTDYKIYMERRKLRNKQCDEIRDAVKEINTLKNELSQIKKILKEIGNK